MQRKALQGLSTVNGNDAMDALVQLNNVLFQSVFENEFEKDGAYVSVYMDAYQPIVVI